MRDYIDIGSTPTEEPCAQVGQPDYARQARAECARFIEAIRQVLGPEPEGAQLAIKSNPHDFGSYFEVVCYYDDNSEAATRYAFRCEAEAPTRWPASSTDGKRPPTVCDSCLTAAYDMGIHDRESQVMLMMELGADVDDHFCDYVEAPGVVTKCLCACRRR